MKVAIYAHRYEQEYPFGMALTTGLRIHGDEPEFRSVACTSPNTKFAIFVKAYPLAGVAELIKGGTSFAFIDLGYDGVRFPDRWRVSINSFRPTRYLGRMYQEDDRRKLFGWEPVKWRIPKPDGHIAVAAGSDRLHLLDDIAPPKYWVQYMEQMVRESRTYGLSQRPIVHRLKGTTGSYNAVLKNCHVVVTHSSIVSYKALMRGIPSIVLGDAITKNIMSKNLDHIEYPFLPVLDQRLVWLNDLAYTQWTDAEFRDGTAWAFIKAQLLEPAYAPPTGDD